MGRHRSGQRAAGVAVWVKVTAAVLTASGALTGGGLLAAGWLDGRPTLLPETATASSAQAPGVVAGQVVEDMVVAAARVLAYPMAGADRAAVVLSRAADRSEQASTTLSTVVLGDVAPGDILAAQAALEVLSAAIDGLRSCALAAGDQPTSVEVEVGQCTDPSALSGAQSAAEAVLPAAGALAEGAGQEVGQVDDLIETLRGQARREAQAGSSFDITDRP